MGRPMGLEPTTSGTTNPRSNPLSYDPPETERGHLHKPARFGSEKLIVEAGPGNIPMENAMLTAPR